MVGRTGAGKSSLIASFFRLAQPSGSIMIDNVECFSIALHELRPTISIIPQDPVLFSGSVRYNLDPFDQYDSERIWNSLKQVIHYIMKSLMHNFKLFYLWKTLVQLFVNVWHYILCCKVFNALFLQHAEKRIL